MRPLKRGKKLGCETAAVSRQAPLWWKIWLGAAGLAALVGLRSLRATDLQAGSQPPFTEPRPCLSGNGKVLAVEARRPSGWQQDIQVHWLDEGRSRVLQTGFDGALVDDSSRHPSLDREGRWLAFSSQATNWVVGDDNSVSDIFVVDLADMQLERLLPPSAEAGLSSSYDASWSADGQQLAFSSYGVPDARSERGRGLVLARRQKQGWSVRPFPGRWQHWGRGPVLGRASFSPDGQRIAYSAFLGGLTPERTRPRFEVYASPLGGDWPPTIHPSRRNDYWERLLLSHSPEGRASRGNSYQPYGSRAGVVFASLAPNLSEGDRNVRHDLFFRPWNQPAPELLTLGANDSSFEPCSSADGDRVVFTSYASNLDSSEPDDNPASDIYLFERSQSRFVRLSKGLQGPCFHPTCSEDGSRVAFVHRDQLVLWERGRGLRVVVARL